MRKHTIFAFLTCLGALFLSNIYADAPTDNGQKKPRGNVGGGRAPLSGNAAEVLHDDPWEAFGAPTSRSETVDQNGKKWSVFADDSGNSWAVNEEGKWKLLKVAPISGQPTEEGSPTAPRAGIVPSQEESGKKSLKEDTKPKL